MLPPLLKAALHPFAGLAPMRSALCIQLHGNGLTNFLGLVSGTTAISLKLCTLLWSHDNTCGTHQLLHKRMPSMSLSCLSCTRPLLRLYFMA